MVHLPQSPAKVQVLLKVVFQASKAPSTPSDPACVRNIPLLSLHFTNFGSLP